MAEQAVLHLCSKEGGDYAITVRQLRHTSHFHFLVGGENVESVS
jgi:hypothetical protein